MPRKVDPSELSAAARQMLSRFTDPPVDLNDLLVVPAAECEGLLQQVYEKYGLETVPEPVEVSSPPASYQWRQTLGRLFEFVRSHARRLLRLRNRSPDG